MRRISSGSPYEEKIGYTRAVVAGGFVFVSGTTGLAPDAPAGTVEEQCALALDRIGAALTEAGCGFADVVRVTYLLPNAADFEPCWPVLRGVFGESRPAATMIEAGLIDPAMKIEIELTAILPAAQ